MVLKLVVYDTSQLSGYGDTIPRFSNTKTKIRSPNGFEKWRSSENRTHKKTIGWFPWNSSCKCWYSSFVQCFNREGLQVDPQHISRRSLPVYVPKQSKLSIDKKDGGLNILRPELWQPPPFLGSWNNNPISMGLKK